MNFTREPIIETIITPKEGFKLIIRSSKGGAEEYSVDAVEVVNFGSSFFYRCLERPKAFLVPVSDYEVIETKETRVVLKNATLERSIKIGGGREAPARALKEPERSPEVAASEAPPLVARLDKKKERRKQRRRTVEERQKPQQEEKPVEEQTSPISTESTPPVAPFSRLFPPPPMLIAETLARYKEKVEPEEKTAEEAPAPAFSDEEFP